MSLENKLTYLNGTKDAIKQAIIGKGVSVTEADTFRSYASKIEEIQGGGGVDCPKNTLDLTDGVDGRFIITSGIKDVILPSNMDNVTNMYSCFEGCASLTSITLPDLPLVTTLKSCFDGCRKLTNITLPSSLPNVTDMGSCFEYCSSLTSITLPDLPNVTYMNYCFYSCRSLQNLVIGNINPNITALTNWYISNCTKLTVESLVNIMNALPTITDTRTCTIGTTNLRKLSPEQLAIGTNKGWTIN